MAATIDDLQLQITALNTQVTALLNAVNVQKSYIDAASQISVSGITGSSGSPTPAVGKSPVGNSSSVFTAAWIDPATNLLVTKVNATTSSAVNYTVVTQSPKTALTAASTTNLAYFSDDRSTTSDGIRLYGIRNSTGSGAGDWQTASYRMERNVDGAGYQANIDFGNYTISFGTSNAKRMQIEATGDITFQASGANLTNVMSINNGPISGRRNRLINGNCAINQRATVNTVVDNQYLTDRWLSNITASLSTNGNIGVGSGSSPSLTGIGNIYMQTLSTPKAVLAAGDYYGFAQKVEGLNVADLKYGQAIAKTCTLSFRALAQGLNQTVAISVTNGALNRSYVTTVTINTAASVNQIYSVIIPGDTTGTWGSDNTVGLVIRIHGLDGSNYYAPALGVWAAGNYSSHSSCTNALSVAGTACIFSDFQFETGNVSTTYELVPYSAELALCQRYYEVNGADFVIGYTLASTNIGYYQSFKVSKRVAPSIAQIANNQRFVQSGVSNSTSNYYPDVQGTTIFRTNGATSGNAQFSENFAASAEL